MSGDVERLAQQNVRSHFSEAIRKLLICKCRLANRFMKRIDIIYFEAASGHKSAAEALKAALLLSNPEWTVRTVDLRDILKCQTRMLDLVYSNGIRFFNWCMRREKYLFFPTCIRLWIGYTRIVTRVPILHFLNRWTSSFWDECPPDAVISVTPMKHTIAYEAARCLNPNVACITVPVDHSEMVPGYWFQPKIQQHYLLGDPGLRDEALNAGVDSSEMTTLSGMVIDHRFYDESPFDRDAFLSDHGLDPSLPTGVISFGGQGTVNVLKCAERTAESQLPVNLICLCGRNGSLLEQVRSMKTPHPIAAFSFNETPPVDALRASDFLIGKPGTMTLNEALITQTAFIFIKSQGLRAVQGANESWVLQHGTGVGCETPEDVDAAIKEVLDNAKIQQQIASHHHRGVFDAVDAIQSLLSTQATDAARCDFNAEPVSVGE